MKKIISCCIVILFCITSFAQIRITEYMYSGTNGEFIEFTNIGTTAIDMNGWSQDDNNRTPGVHNLSGFGTVQPGESVILTESAASTFRNAWGLCAGIKIIGGYSNDNLGRSDEINLYDASNNLVDRLTYNDQGTGSVKGPRTDTKSAWVTASAMGANNASLWTLSTVGGSENGFTSAGGDIGSPGKSTRSVMVFNPCASAGGSPTIVMDINNTSNYLDGGTIVAPLSPFGVSGTLNDPTDPAKNLGIHFILNDTDTPITGLTVTLTSSNTVVVPLANLQLSGSGASRNLKIVPATVGLSTITLTVSDGINTTSYKINYAASAASSDPNHTVWATGMSDASAAIALDDDYYIAGDDELNTLNVYSRTSSGLPFKTYDYTSSLNLPQPSKPEIDLEAATRSISVGNKIYWLGSLSNGKEPFDNKPNRNRLFATTITGTGASTAFTFSGYYDNLRASLINWGDIHGYNFTASAAAGIDSKAINGFAAEGMVFGPDNTTLYIGLRAPLVPTANRTKAVIAPIVNFETWFNNGSPSGNPIFDSPIELNLGGRGIRDLIRLSNGTYIIIAGNYGDGAVNTVIYKWSGNKADVPVPVTNPALSSLNAEGVMPINAAGQLSTEQLQIITDKGADILYNDGTEAKDLSDLNLRKFQLETITNLDLHMCEPTASTHIQTACNDFTWNGTTYTQSGIYKDTTMNVAGCDSVIILQLTIVLDPTAIITASGPTTFCPGDSVVLTTTADLNSYTWSTGEQTRSIVIHTAGSYSVQVSNGFCPVITSDTVTVTLNIIQGDSNSDGIVSVADLNELISLFGQNCNCTSDSNGDGKVSTIDLNLILANYGRVCNEENGLNN